MKARLAGLGYAAGWSLVKLAPAPVAGAVFRAGAEIAHRRDGAGARQLRANLARVLGPDRGPAELDDVVRRGLQSYARYWKETFRLPVIDPADVLDRTEVSGWEHVDAPRRSGRGVVVGLTHSGNWDASAIVFLDHLREPFTTVAERLAPESLFDRFVAYRQSLGMEVLALTGGDRPVASVLTARLRAGRCVCLLADRDLGRAAIEVRFFGEIATMPPGPMLLAATTGAALVPMNGSYTAAGWRMEFGPEVDVPAAGRLRDRVRAGAQGLAAAFEPGIAAHPEDWHMLQPVWPADRVVA